MHQPRKRFGQHFLRDKTVIEKILAYFQPKPDQTILEIGPGLGALTIPLLKQHSPLMVVELDRDVIPKLKESSAGIGELIIFQQDVLSFNFSQVASPNQLRIIGNLPYNISTPLLFHLITYKSNLQDMVFMLQKEVVDRMAAKVNTKDYGRLSIMLQTEFYISPLFDVPPSAFMPPPKVNSAVVYLTPRNDDPFGKILDKKIFADIVREAFQHRRKTLRNALEKYFTVTMLQECNINPQQRPGELSINNYVTLANFLKGREESNV